jgi:hypothetical protein
MTLINQVEAGRIVETLMKIASVKAKGTFYQCTEASSEEEVEYSKWMIKFFDQ